METSYESGDYEAHHDSFTYEEGEDTLHISVGEEDKAFLMEGNDEKEDDTNDMDEDLKENAADGDSCDKSNENVTSSRSISPKSTTPIRESRKSGEGRPPLSPSKASNMIVVTGLPSTVRATEVKALFKQHAKILGVRIITTSKSANSRRFAHVLVTSAAGVEHCIEALNNSDFDGHTITLEKGTAEHLALGSKKSRPSKRERRRAKEQALAEKEAVSSSTESQSDQQDEHFETTQDATTTPDLKTDENKDKSCEDAGVSVASSECDGIGKHENSPDTSSKDTKPTESIKSDEEVTKKEVPESNNNHSSKKSKSTSDAKSESSKEKTKTQSRDEKASSSKDHSHPKSSGENGTKSSSSSSRKRSDSSRRRSAERRGEKSGSKPRPNTTKGNTTHGGRHSPRRMARSPPFSSRRPRVALPVRSPYRPGSRPVVRRSPPPRTSPPFSSRRIGRRSGSSNSHSRSRLTFEKIREHRDKEKAREEGRRNRERDRLHQDELARQLELEKKNMIDYEILQREKEKLRREREKVQRDKEELIRLERDRQRAERERIEREKEDLRRAQMSITERRKRTYEETEVKGAEYSGLATRRPRFDAETRRYEAPPPPLMSSTYSAEARYVSERKEPRVQYDRRSSNATSRYPARATGGRVTPVREAPARSVPMWERDRPARDARERIAYREKEVVKDARVDTRDPRTSSRADRDHMVRTAPVITDMDPRFAHSSDSHRSAPPVAKYASSARGSEMYVSSREPDWSRRPFNTSSNDLSQGSTSSGLSREAWLSDRKIEPWSSVSESRPTHDIQDRWVTGSGSLRNQSVSDLPVAHAHTYAPQTFSVASSSSLPQSYHSIERFATRRF